MAESTDLGQKDSHLNYKSLNEDLLKAPQKERVLSSLRIKYEAQIEVIKKQIGDLETVRKTLNLSQRQICQLLLVDPSAWTRWTRPGENPPPHIYRALSWYMLIQEKIPGLTPQYFLNQSHQALEKEMSASYQKLASDYQQLSEELKVFKKRQRIYSCLLCMTFLVGVLNFYWH